MVVTLTPVPGVTFPSDEITPGVIVTGEPVGDDAVCTDVVFTGEFNGAPTAISHLCPACPCGGFMPGAVLAGAAAVGVILVIVEGACCEEVVIFAGWFNGAPNAISHLWPGCPCGGFIPGAVAWACG